uniref:Uncharacterized protein n=1 Tax=viral metagenome TaxID=1070528 RepID=A0A6M3IS70_9ZZZZ
MWCEKCQKYTKGYWGDDYKFEESYEPWCICGIEVEVQFGMEVDNKKET